ncbi:MAG: tetratricopeptide repeat protein [Gemmatimonadetes bacterium]|nr:tetratricopeptide repeat protein [Gemmatimonadota bacterium]
MAHAVAGQTARARAELERYEAEVPIGVRRGRWSWYEARGWLALAEGRAQDAVAAFTAGRLVDGCPDCGNWEEGLAFERANQPDSALAAYQRAVAIGSTRKPNGDIWGLGPSLQRLGELYESRGDTARALEAYSRLLELWKDADPVLQPAVTAVRARMAHLTGEAK